MNNLFSILNNLLFRKKEEKSIKLYNKDDSDNKNIVIKKVVKEIVKDKKLEVDEEKDNNEYYSFQDKKIDEVFEQSKLKVLNYLIEEEEKEKDLFYLDSELTNIDDAYDSF